MAVAGGEGGGIDPTEKDDPKFPTRSGGGRGGRSSGSSSSLGEFVTGATRAPSPAPTRAPRDREPSPLASSPIGGVTDLVRLTPFSMPTATPVTNEEEDTEILGKRPVDYGILGSFSPLAAKERTDAKGEAEKRKAKDYIPDDEGKTIRRRSYEMTWEDYNNLSERQRAAVDFNTLLVEAREKDLNADYKPSKDQQTIYNQTVDRIFGEENGSEIYAPETLAVLDQINFTAKKDEDLDDFLGLKTAISRRDLKNFDLGAVLGPPSPSTPEVASSPLMGLQQQLAQYTDVLEQSMVEANQLMSSFQKTAAAQRNDMVGFLGGTMNKISPEVGYGGSTDDELFKVAYETLADKRYADDMKGALNLVEQNMSDKVSMEDFYNYVDVRIRAAEEHSLPLGNDLKEARYHTPQEFREMLGLDKGA